MRGNTFSYNIKHNNNLCQYIVIEYYCTNCLLLCLYFPYLHSVGALNQGDYYHATCDTIVQANSSTMALKAMSINLPLINLIYNNL